MHAVSALTQDIISVSFLVLQYGGQQSSVNGCFLHSFLTQYPIGQLDPVFVVAIGNSVGGGGLYFLLHIGMSPSDFQERSMALTGQMFDQINTIYYPSSKT